MPTSEAQKKWFLEHKEQKREYDKQYRLKQGAERLRKKAEYYQKTKPERNRKTKEWAEANREKRRDYSKRYALKNKDRCAAATRAWYQKNREHALKMGRERNLKRFYGLTMEQFNQILKSQKGKCLICKLKITAKTPHVDHCHKTGAVRGILCNNCNSGLGMFKDCKKRLLSAMEYLENHGRTTALTAS